MNLWNVELVSVWYLFSGVRFLVLAICWENSTLPSVHSTVMGTTVHRSEVGSIVAGCHKHPLPGKVSRFRLTSCMFWPSNEYLYLFQVQPLWDRNQTTPYLEACPCVPGVLWYVTCSTSCRQCTQSQSRGRIKRLKFNEHLRARNDWRRQWLMVVLTSTVSCLLNTYG